MQRAGDARRDGNPKTVSTQPRVARRYPLSRSAGEGQGEGDRGGQTGGVR